MLTLYAFTSLVFLRFPRSDIGNFESASGHGLWQTVPTRLRPTNNHISNEHRIPMIQDTSHSSLIDLFAITIVLIPLNVNYGLNNFRESAEPDCEANKIKNVKKIHRLVNIFPSGRVGTVGFHVPT